MSEGGAERVVRTQIYGKCPRGHGDENGEIAAEVSAAARHYPNCPICGIALEDTCEAEIVRSVNADMEWSGNAGMVFQHRQLRRPRQDR